jgi:hypothetical protein
MWNRGRLDAVFRRFPMHDRARLSDLLDDLLAARPDDPHITLREAVEHLGVRAYGPLLLIFALPNAIPNVPGLSSLFGLPLLFFAVQMALGRTPWLPAFLADRGLARSTLQSVSDKARPWLARADKAVRPRLLPLSSPTAERVLGVYVFILAFAIALPAPLTNMFPSWAIAAIAIGILDRDGVWIAGGALWGLVALGIVALAMVAAVSALMFAF